MNIEIKNRFTGKIIICGEYESIKDCIEKNRGANLRGANLIDANLIGANLRDANLIGANLRGANLIDANLIGANLIGANLRGANLIDANLIGANLRGANLIGANLRGANLIGANLVGADLIDADLRDANLIGANLNEKIKISYTTITPDGDIIGWKKCNDNIIVKLKIPAKAKRSNATGRKCRAEYVRVLEIIGGKIGIAQYDGKTKYQVGKTVKCDKWDDNRWNECSGGIHFFLTREEAERY